MSGSAAPGRRDDLDLSERSQHGTVAEDLRAYCGMSLAQSYDVIVIGGGAAGTAAAIGAASTGARTLLVESAPFLGGAATLKNVLTYCGLFTNHQRRQAVFGVADQVLRQLRVMGAVSEPIQFHGVAVLIEPESVKYTLEQLCKRAGVHVCLHTMLLSATRNGDHITAVTLHDHNGNHEVSANAFVDASGEGDLAFFGGASVRYGNHEAVQTGTLSMRLGGIGADADLSQYGLFFRVPITNDVATYFIDEKYDARDAQSLTEAEIDGREQARAYLQAIRKLPGCENAYILATGPEIGTRESRHVDALYQVTTQDIESGAHFDDVVCLGAWPMEYHTEPGQPTVWRMVHENDAYDIPLRTLCSRDTPNLFVGGRLTDGDSYAGGSLRVMGTSFGTGHGAGVAAAIYAQSKERDYVPVQRELLRQNAHLALDQEA
ncbi:MAG: FAD-dependent oxidoreductase [Labilithrix sp.]|nr:FAD-dependent oxidoreductase [Labilithrix sp.]